MKLLRSIICVSAVAVAATASALETGNTFARLPVTDAPKSAIIALPFSGCGMAEGRIYVTNLVMTPGLAAGDTLLYKDSSGNWYAWEISGGKWTSIASSTKDGVRVSDHPENFTLPCGEACWLDRSASGGTFYLYGQVNASKTDVTIPAGVDGKPTYTIVGCPYEVGTFDITTLPSKVKSGDSVAEGDTILLMDNDPSSSSGKVEYTYRDGAWKKKTYTSGSSINLGGVTIPSSSSTPVWTAVGADDLTTVPAGCGFMYGRKANTALTITWGD